MRVLEFSDREGVLGMVTLDNGTLTGSTPGMRRMVTAALGYQNGDPEAAFTYLAEKPSNGYVWVSSRADQ